MTIIMMYSAVYEQILKCKVSGELVKLKGHLIYQIYIKLTTRLLDNVDEAENAQDGLYMEVFTHLLPLFAEFNLVFSDKLLWDYFQTNNNQIFSIQKLRIIYSICHTYKGAIITQEMIFKNQHDVWLTFLTQEQAIMKYFLKIIRVIFEMEAQTSYIVDLVNDIYNILFCAEGNLGNFDNAFQQNQLYKLLLISKEFLQNFPYQSKLNYCFYTIRRSYKLALNFSFLFNSLDKYYYDHYLILLDLLQESQVDYNYQYKWYLLIKRNLFKLMDVEGDYFFFLINHYYSQSPFEFHQKIEKLLAKNYIFIFIFDKEMDL